MYVGEGKTETTGNTAEDRHKSLSDDAKELGEILNFRR